MPFLNIGDAWKYYDMGHMANYEFLQLNTSQNYSAKKTHQQKRKRKRKLKTDPSLTRQVKNQQPVSAGKPVSAGLLFQAFAHCFCRLQPPPAVQSSPPKTLFLRLLLHLPSSSSFFPANSLSVVCTFSYFFFAFLVQVP